MRVLLLIDYSNSAEHGQQSPDGGSLTGGSDSGARHADCRVSFDPSGVEFVERASYGRLSALCRVATDVGIQD
jgi:hypothetical protein